MGQGEGQLWCGGIVTEINPVTGRTTQRRCPLVLDPILVTAGFMTHPCCDPGEVSELWPPETAGVLRGRVVQLDERRQRRGRAA